MREHLAHQHDPCDQIIRPVAGFSEGCERNRADNPTANPKRDAQMRSEARPPAIFGLADSFRRKIVGRIPDDKRFAGAEFGCEPVKLRREWTQGRSVNAVYG
nr:hypothetical protein [Bradyrhizobium rifense]